MAEVLDCKSAMLSKILYISTIDQNKMTIEF